jgi:CRISPR-associated protein Cmr2
VRDDADWPYDGDLLYLEGLTPARLKDSYGLEVAETHPDLKAAQRLLRETYDQTGYRPALYYGIIVLDGDNMGAHVSRCLDAPDPAAEHRSLSRSLANYAAQVRPLVKESTGGLDALVYNGGDDVLALAPLVSVLTTGQKLAQTFQSSVAGGTASAGIAIAHHTYPLGAALRAAREAERQAKLVPGKTAVCVRVLKRSGDTAEMRSSWAALDNMITKLVQYFIGDEQGEFLSSKFAYDVAQAAYALPEGDDKWEAEVKRLILRHRNTKRTPVREAEEWAKRLAGELRAWAMALPEGPADLGRWLIFARFLAQRGGE